MRDATLLKIAIFCAVAGLTSLFFVSRNIKVELTPIEKINLMENKEVAIEGTVQNVGQKEGLTVLEVGYETSIQVAIFEKADIRRGDQVTVRGELKEYNGRMEIVGKEVTVK